MQKTPNATRPPAAPGPRSHAKSYDLYIDGAFRTAAGGKTFESIDPHNGAVVARFARAGARDVEAAVAAARRAFDSGPWPRLSGAERGAFLRTISEKINERTPDLEQLEVADSGSTIRKVKEDVKLSARAMYYYSKLAGGEFTSQVDGLSKPGFSRNFLVREPVGVVAAVIPWNFPLKMAVWKLGPALAAGNTVVLKPSEITPVTAMELAAMFHEAGFPHGVVNILPGFGEDAGDLLVSDPRVDMVSFTGSTAVGRSIMGRAASTLKKCTLECGGKSANIVLDDADPGLAVDGALYAVYYHQGQCCEAGTRLFLPDSLHDRFVQAMLAKIARMKIGDPRDPATDIGPLVSARQRDRVLGYIKSGVDQGAKLAAGGGVPKVPGTEKGFYVEPTLFTGVRNDMKIAREEIFGPVLSVLRYRTVDEAVAMANDSAYGLGAGVWSADVEKAVEVGKRLRAGTVWVNEWHLISEKAPFGGYKQSGIGREFGLEGLHEYMEIKHMHVDEIGSREKKFWYDVVVPKSS
ncbi:MAG TPA: aldehyde dehydrogenase family protein [Bacteroidota bacterium]|nr:aldehyde dehydrogenase family protein [Bacteroidota bacterium]